MVNFKSREKVPAGSGKMRKSWGIFGREAGMRGEISISPENIDINKF